MKAGFWRIAIVIMLCLAIVFPGSAMAAGIYWRQADSGITDQNFDGLEWNGQLYVAVGTGGVIVTSPDGFNWTQRNSGGTSHLYDVLWNGSKFLVAGAGGILSSPDGITWNKVHDAAGITLTDIAWNGSCYVVVGDSGYIAASPDGRPGSWSIIPSGTSEKLEGVAWGNGKFVAVGRNGVILTSSAGSIWAASLSGTSEWLVDVEWLKSCSSFEAVGDKETRLFSADGLTWNSLSGSSGKWLLDLDESSRSIVEVGSGGYIVVDNYFGPWIQNSGTSEWLTDVKWNGHQFVVVGTNGTILVSSTVDRIYGSNRYETAVNISKKGWAGGAPTVILARGDNYADALAGVPLAYAEDAPILLTSPGSLNSATKGEIIRLKAGKVIILGGTGAVSAQVEQELKNMGLIVSRIAGSNRFDTAANILDYSPVLSAANTVVIAYGHNFPDALAVASYAAKAGYPILLVNRDSIPQATMDCLLDGFMAHRFDNSIVVGGTGVISNQVMNKLANPIRICGDNRYATSSALANHFLPSSHQAYAATGMGFADAITGAVLAAKESSGILLTGNNVSADVENCIHYLDMWGVTILGGPGAVGNNVYRRFQEILP